MASAKYTLPPLPYAYDVSYLIPSLNPKPKLTYPHLQALEPYISFQIMTLHHTKHHQTYITNLNLALSSQATASTKNDIISQLHLQSAINFAAGGHINHTLFWENLSPPTSPSASPSSAPTLISALTTRYGSLENFQSKFNAVLLGLKGSGWGWLVQDVESGGLEIITSKDQDIVPQGKKPLLGVDMWEHAYYLQYLNDKGGYAKGIWNIVNWERVEERFTGSEEAVFGSLKGLRGSL
jgi:superoxide dismutase, Fe-Mn family